MSLQSDIQAAVEGAVSDALNAAQDEWRTSPEMMSAGMMTDAAMKPYPGGADGTIEYDTGRQQIKANVRDMYGVARKDAVIRCGRKRKKIHPETLMQKTSETLENSFITAFEDRMRTL